MGSEVEQLQQNPNPTTNTNINKLNENKDTISTENNANGNITVTKKTLSLIQPHSLLPKPTPPISNSHPQSPNSNDVVQLNFKTFFRQRSNDLTSAITRTISSIKNSIDDNNDQNDDVTEFKLSGLKVVVTVKNDASLGIVRITLFSRSNCRDCSAVRRFFRERGLKFVEINIDVYTERGKELNQRIGNSNSNSTVPMIFFNEKLIGGLVELNAMRTNGELEKKLIEISNGGFSGDVPVAPAYGFDEVAEEKVAVEEEIAKVVRVLRQRLPIQDRLMKMKIVRNCFDGNELVELLVRNHGYVHDKVRLFS
jgi:glutaredoxin